MVAIITPAKNMQAISIVNAAARNTAMQIMISSFMLLAEKKVKNKTYENQNTNKRGQRHPEYPFNVVFCYFGFFHFEKYLKGFPSLSFPQSWGMRSKTKLNP